MAQDLLYLILTEDDDEDDVPDERHVFQGAEGGKKVNNLYVKSCACLDAYLTIAQCQKYLNIVIADLLSSLICD